MKATNMKSADFKQLTDGLRSLSATINAFDVEVSRLSNEGFHQVVTVSLIELLAIARAIEAQTVAR